jgi:hypothetical protein
VPVIGAFAVNPRRFHSIHIIAGLLGTMTLVMSVGCYRHVVGVEGAGSGDVKIYEPNLKEPNDSVYTTNKSVPSKSVPSKTAP